MSQRHINMVSLIKSPPELIQRSIVLYIKGEKPHDTTHKAHINGSENISQVHQSMHGAHGQPMRLAPGYKGQYVQEMEEHVAIACGSQFATSSKRLQA